MGKYKLLWLQVSTVLLHLPLTLSLAVSLSPGAQAALHSPSQELQAQGARGCLGAM